MKKLFTPDRYTPTQFSSAADKAKFANQFVRFVESGFKETIFPKWFYTRLSMTFWNIAHYNQAGFYGTWFTTVSDQIRFLQNTCRGGQYGSAAFTFCDVERDIAEWVMKSGLIQKLQATLGQMIETSERATLARLQAKYPALAA